MLADIQKPYIMKQKNHIVKLVMATAIIVLSATQSLSAQTIQQPYIDAQATVERQVTPDELYISITIKESDYKGKKTLQEMQDAMLGVLKQNRIDIPECLSINYMGSDVSYKIFSRKPIPQSQAKYRLKLYDASIMQDVIYDLEERGISNIELVETKYTKKDELITELGVEAMKKAQAQATSLAGAIGQQAGKAISISSWSSQSNPQPRYYKTRSTAIVEESADNAAGMEPQVAIGKLTFSVNVNVRFELN